MGLQTSINDSFNTRSAALPVASPHVAGLDKLHALEGGGYQAPDVRAMNNHFKAFAAAPSAEAPHVSGLDLLDARHGDPSVVESDTLGRLAARYDRSGPVRR